jgi:hypothetical protein
VEALGTAAGSAGPPPSPQSQLWGASWSRTPSWRKAEGRVLVYTDGHVHSNLTFPHHPNGSTECKPDLSKDSPSPFLLIQAPSLLGDGEDERGFQCPCKAVLRTLLVKGELSVTCLVQEGP